MTSTETAAFRYYMHERSSQIMVAMEVGSYLRVIIVMVVSVPMVMVVVVAQKKSTKQVDTKPKCRNRNGLIKGNRHRVKKTVHAFIADQQRNHC